jgi:thiamine-monophosphate kinase
MNLQDPSQQDPSQQDPSQQDPSQQTALAEIGEFGLIAMMRDTLGDPTDDALVSGIADDAAVYRVDDERVHVLTTDTSPSM